MGIKPPRVRANVKLHIEELVLHGFPPGDRYRIAEEVQLELERLFAEGGVSRRLAMDGEAAAVDAGAFELRRGARTDAIGAPIAQAVYRGINQ